MDFKSFMTKVQQGSGLDSETCNLMLASLIEVTETSLSDGDIVSIPSFGNFEPRKRNERIMSHPSNPQKRFLVPPKVVVNFKPSAILKNKLNNKDVE